MHTAISSPASALLCSARQLQSCDKLSERISLADRNAQFFDVDGPPLIPSVSPFYFGFRFVAREGEIGFHKTAEDHPGYTRLKL
jgi:hypothetical protein